MDHQLGNPVTDTKGRCLLCNAQMPPEIPSSTTSFRCLSRYLNLNLSKLQKDNNPISDHQNKTQLIEESLELIVPLCHECAPLINDTFAEVYRQLKKIEGEMSSCLNLIREKLENSQMIKKSRKRGYPAEASLVEDVRQEVMGKCSLKLSKLFPEKNLEEGDQDEEGPLSPQDSYTNTGDEDDPLKSGASSDDTPEVEEILPSAANVKTEYSDESEKEDEHDDDLDGMSLEPEGNVEEGAHNAAPTETAIAPVVLGTYPYHQQVKLHLATSETRTGRQPSSSRQADPANVAHYDAFTCGVCKKRFTTSGAKSNHQRTHFTPRFSCPHCPYKAHRNSMLVHHITHKHGPSSNQNLNQ